MRLIPSCGQASALRPSIKNVLTNKPLSPQIVTLPEAPPLLLNDNPIPIHLLQSIAPSKSRSMVLSHLVFFHAGSIL